MNPNYFLWGHLVSFFLLDIFSSCIFFHLVSIFASFEQLPIVHNANTSLLLLLWISSHMESARIHARTCAFFMCSIPRFIHTFDDISVLSSNESQGGILAWNYFQQLRSISSKEFDSIIYT